MAFELHGDGCAQYDGGCQFSGAPLDECIEGSVARHEGIHEIHVQSSGGGPKGFEGNRTLLFPPFYIHHALFGHVELLSQLLERHAKCGSDGFRPPYRRRVLLLKTSKSGNFAVDLLQLERILAHADAHRARVRF